MSINPRPCAAFYSVELVGGGGCSADTPAVRPQMELDPCEKGRVALNERKAMVHNFKVSVQLMTSEVRSNTRSRPLYSGCCKVDRNE